MAISPYIRALREQVGGARLLLPSVSVHISDAAGRVLLVRQRDDDVWSTPGGLIEPDERPADAAVREAWEETGLLVRADSVRGVYGGPDCVVRYPNGDEAQYVIIAFGCTVVGGSLRADGDETVDVAFWSEADASRLALAPWLRAFLSHVYHAGDGAPAFDAASWTPPSPVTGPRP